MRIRILLFGILITTLKIVCGSSFSENLKFCVFVGDDFDIVTFSASIKRKSENMIFSVVIKFEQLSSFLGVIPSNTMIVTSETISLIDLLSTTTDDLYWRTTSDFINLATVSRSFKHENKFCGSTLTIGIITEEGICDNMIGKNVFQKTDCYHYQLMDMLGQRLNFTKKVVELVDKRYPYIFPNGSHSGLFRMVSDQNVDVSCGSFVVTSKRLDEHDFLWPTFFLETMMYLKREEIENPWANFMKPFEKDVWAAVILYIILSSFVRYILHRFLYSESTEASLYNSFLLSLQIFCNQGAEEIPCRLSIRLVHLLSLLVVIILNPVYSGSVVSFLTIDIPHLPFRDFEEFVTDKRFSLLTSEGDFMTYYLYFEVGDTFTGKRENLMVGLKNLAKNAKDGMKRMCKGEAVTYTDSKQNLADLMEGLECSVVEVPSHIFIQHLGMIIDENLPCRDRLASELRYLRSTGIIQKMQSEMIPALAFARLRTVENGFETISMAEIYPCLVLQALGLLSALFIFLLEIIFGEKYQESYIKQRRRLHLRSLVGIRCGIPVDVDTLMM